MVIKLDKQARYNRDYYRKKRGEISIKRKKRYHSDPDIREAIVEKSRKYREKQRDCLLYTSPSPRDATLSRMPSSA